MSFTGVPAGARTQPSAVGMYHVFSAASHQTKVVKCFTIIALICVRMRGSTTAALKSSSKPPPQPVCACTRCMMCIPRSCTVTHAFLRLSVRRASWLIGSSPSCCGAKAGTSACLAAAALAAACCARAAAACCARAAAAADAAASGRTGAVTTALLLFLTVKSMTSVYGIGTVASLRGTIG